MTDIKRKMIAAGLAMTILTVGISACTKENTAETQPSEGTVIESQAEPVVGGWAMSASPNVRDEQRTLFENAMKTLLGVDYEPVAYLASQVVAGTNHCYLCKATVVAPDATPTYKLVYIYEKLDGTTEVLGFQDVTPAGGATGDGQFDGGWTYADDAMLNGEREAILDKACETLAGAEYIPAAYIASQVVEGTNHAFVCKEVPSTQGLEDPGKLVVVTVWEKLDGSAEILEVADLELGNYTK
ncbi:hypothetical protein SAMN02910456_00416 [Ruminococcaceae bacterium YRB3002]|nr:hypothetical protein SAMN02910456_00416 [Ruminococcaceae bacterium YRB3002]